jgi:Uma2 family endonuclease
VSGSPHARAAFVLGNDLGPPFDRPLADPDGPGGWWLLSEPELHLGSDVVVPDCVGWRRERMPHLPNVAAFTLAPDWVCDVVSPSTGPIDRGRKMWIYARERVPHLWIVAATRGGDDVVRAEPFDGDRLRLARWWLEP